MARKKNDDWNDADESTPMFPGWYPVLQCWNPDEGFHPFAAYWNGDRWSENRVSAWGNVEPCEDQAEALVWARDNNPDW